MQVQAIDGPGSESDEEAEGGADAAGEPGADAVPSGCDAKIVAARLLAKQIKAELDRTGILGAVCHHGVIVLGSFIDMRTPEMFIYYLLVLLDVLVRAPNIQHVYVDFACQLKKTWRWFVESSHVPAHLRARLREVKLWVNWMHGASHKLSCQMQHCGRLQVGAGRRVGECCEQTWSQARVRVLTVMDDSLDGT